MARSTSYTHILSADQGRTVKKYLQSQGLQIKDLADKLGYSSPFVSKRITAPSRGIHQDLANKIYITLGEPQELSFLQDLKSNCIESTSCEGQKNKRTALEDIYFEYSGQLENKYFASADAQKLIILQGLEKLVNDQREA